jgi:glycosyltransferase involved in cell wall biosynthesis
LTAGIGGIITVIEIVNGLIRSGIHANIAYIGKKQIDLDLLFEPIYYETFEHFCTFPPESKVFVATDNGTVQYVQLLSTSHHIETAYFIQDYEGWFDKKNLDFVKKTYSQIENKIVVSHWIQKMIKTNDNYDSTVINVGVPTEIFYKQNKTVDELKELKNNCKIIVLSLLSNYERRGSTYFIQAMREILEKYDDIGFAFTQRSHNNLVDFEDPRIINLNMIEREQMPNYFSNCDVIVDASLYHGFGLPGLEGMSVSLAPILTDVELDYAVNGENSVLIQPKNVEDLKNAIIQLYEDTELLSKLKHNARQSAISFDWNKLIPKYVDYFESLIQKFDADKIRPNFGYEKYLRTKNILEIIKSAPIIQQPSQLTKKNANPKNILASFLYDSKKFGFTHACKESIRWISK